MKCYFFLSIRPYIISSRSGYFASNGYKVSDIKQVRFYNDTFIIILHHYELVSIIFLHWRGVQTDNNNHGGNLDNAISNNLV